MSKFEIAIIGAGRMGKTHYDNLMQFRNVQIKYVYEPHLSEWHKQNFCPDKLTSDLSQIIDDKSIEAVVISVPSAFHVEFVEIFAKARKHIFCEKPVSFTLEGLNKAKDVVARERIALQVGFNRRFDPSFREIKNKIEKGEIGDIQLIKITNRDPKRANLEFVKNSGGLFFDFNIHDFDMIHYISGVKIDEIYAIGDALIQPELKAYKDIDTALISMRLENGALAIVDTSRESGYGYDQQLEVFGSKGMLIAGNRYEHASSYVNREGYLSARPEYSFVERYRESYFLQFEEFFSSLKSKKDPTPNLGDAILAVEVAIACQKSWGTSLPQVKH